MTEQPPTIENVRGNRWLYGANVAITVVVALALVVIVNYLANRFHYRQDMTFGRLYSLSPSTTSLLKQYDNRGEKVEVVSLPASRDSERALKIADLLGEYASHSSSVQVLKIDNRDELETLIYQRFEKEAAPYQKALEKFDELSRKASQLCEAEGASINDFLQDGTFKTPNDIQELKNFQQGFSKVFPEGFTEVTAKAKKARNDFTVPHWSTAVAVIREPVNELEKYLQYLISPEYLNRASPTLANYHKSRVTHYNELLKILTPFQAMLGSLKPLKFDDAMASCRPDSVVVLGKNDVKVVSDAELFRPEQPRNPGDKPTETFTGEQALSSALLAMTMPEKPRVVFVSPAAQQLTTGMYAEISDRLRKSNFEVLEWAASPTMNPQDGPPPSPEPPAFGKGVVWIVVPADPVNPQMMMRGMLPPDTGALAAAIDKHIAAGGNTLFLAEAAGSMPGMPDSGVFPYANLIKPYGVLAKPNFGVVRSVPMRDGNTQTIPIIDVTQYPDHPITHPIQSLLSMFPGQVTRMGFMGAPTVVMVDPNRPSNTAARVIVETSRDSDTWATPRMALDASFDPKSDDMKSPVPMAVAAELPAPPAGATTTAPATRPAGPSRIVVIGNKYFLHNDLIQDTILVDDSGARRGSVASRFPGNAELALNSVFWLAGYENMIAVSPRATAALRIRDIDPAFLPWLKGGFIFVGPPIAALMLGAFVYWRRRR